MYQLKNLKSLKINLKSVAANIDNKITPSSGGATISNNAMDNIITYTGAITCYYELRIKRCRL